MKVFAIIGIILVMGGILFPLFTYFRAEYKENNKLNKGKKGNSNKDNSNNTSQDDKSEKVLMRANTPKNYTFGYTQEVLDFDNIVPCNKDAALLKINDYEFLGYLEVQGVPFNLLSNEERLSLEGNYGDLLNGVDYEFQMYIQSRSLKLDNYVDRYKLKIDELKKKVTSLEEKLITVSDPNELKRINIELQKKNRQLDYGYDLLDDFKLKNVDSELLERRYYIILKYTHDTSEFGDLTDREILEFAYNDLANKANLFIDSLVRNKLECHFLNGVQIAELLYNSFNKEDASSLKIENAIKAKYNHLCTTSKPIFLKEIEKEIDKTEEEQKILEKNIQDNFEILTKKVVE